MYVLDIPLQGLVLIRTVATSESTENVILALTGTARESDGRTTSTAQIEEIGLESDAGHEIGML